jgi:hypothetical protein
MRRRVRSCRGRACGGEGSRGGPGPNHFGSKSVVSPCGLTASGPLPNCDGPSTNRLSGRRARSRYRVRPHHGAEGVQSWTPRRKSLKPL